MVKPVKEDRLVRHVTDDFVDQLVSLRSAGHAAAPSSDAFDRIQQTMTIQLKNGRTTILEVGEPFGQGGAWARIQNQQDRMMVLPKSRLQLMNTRAIDLMKTDRGRP